MSKTIADKNEVSKALAQAFVEGFIPPTIASSKELQNGLKFGLSLYEYRESLLSTSKPALPQ